MRLLTIGLLLVSALMVRAYPEPQPEPKEVPPPKADIRGNVEMLTVLKGRGVLGSLRIVGSKEKDTQYDQAVVRVPSTAKIYLWKDGKKVEAKFADLKKGDTVQAIFTGPVAESYPVQATAGEVLILPTKR
ncbi:MAG: DUF3221 domain-containing protein [Gemmataceae bacterium]